MLTALPGGPALLWPKDPRGPEETRAWEDHARLRPGGQELGDPQPLSPPATWTACGGFRDQEKPLTATPRNPQTYRRCHFSEAEQPPTPGPRPHPLGLARRSLCQRDELLRTLNKTPFPRKQTAAELSVGSRPTAAGPPRRGAKSSICSLVPSSARAQVAAWGPTRWWQAARRKSGR